MTFGTDMRSWLQGLAVSAEHDPGARFHENTVPPGYAGPYVWFQRRTRSDELTFDMQPGQIPFEIFVDLEAIARGPEALALAAEIAQQSHGYRGPFGDGTVQAVFCEDHGDDYTPRGLMAEQALQYGALELRVIGYSPGS